MANITVIINGGFSTFYRSGYTNVNENFVFLGEWTARNESNVVLGTNLQPNGITFAVSDFAMWHVITNDDDPYRQYSTKTRFYKYKCTVVYPDSLTAIGFEHKFSDPSYQSQGGYFITEYLGSVSPKIFIGNVYNPWPSIGTTEGKTVTYPVDIYAKGLEAKQLVDAHLTHLIWDWGDGTIEQIPLSASVEEDYLQTFFDDNFNPYSPRKISVGTLSGPVEHTFTLDANNNGSGVPISIRPVDSMGRIGAKLSTKWKPFALFEPTDVYAETEDESDTGKYSFDATNSYDLDGSIVKFAWSFGDGQGVSGNAATARQAQHVYAPREGDSERIFNVTLTVKDNDGLTGTVTKPITVKDVEIGAQIDALVLADGRVVTCAQDGKDVVTRVLYPLANGLKKLEESRVTGAKLGALAAKRDTTLVRTLRRATAIEMETSSDGGKTWR